MKSSHETTEWKAKTGRGVKIILLDSGVNTAHPELVRFDWNQGAQVVRTESGLQLGNQFADSLGHGTAIAAILKRLVPDAEIFPIKIFQEQLEVDVEHLIYALEHVVESLDGQIVHLSLGLTYGGEIARLRELCEELERRGTLIVSAFDNAGAISYPAAFAGVIGVDASFRCKGDYEYEFVAGQLVNLRAKGSHQRLAWVEPPYIFRGGASFAAPYVTAYLAKWIEAGVTDRTALFAALRAEATFVYEAQPQRPRTTLFPISRAVIYPFNKEMHSLVRFQDLLSFQLYAICDSKYSGQIGQPVSNILRGLPDTGQSIQNIDHLDWTGDFDTLILGHVGWFSQATGSDMLELFLQSALEHGKHVYCFDSLNAYRHLVAQAEAKGLKFECPVVTLDDLPANRFGKLRRIGKPVLGVFGTSSRQGKVTLQLGLRRRFLRDGYRVGQLGTEPSSLLYGMDEVYPMGYNSTVEISGYHALIVLNEMMSRIEDQDPDIILVGSQSGTVPYDFGNAGQYTFPALDLYLGTSPDAVILVVNLDDDIEYVRRTVQVLENLGHSQVVALAIFPLQKTVLPWAGIKMNPSDAQELEAYRAMYAQELGKAAYVLRSDAEVDELYERVVAFFAGEEEAVYA